MRESCGYLFVLLRHPRAPLAEPGREPPGANLPSAEEGVDFKVNAPPGFVEDLKARFERVRRAKRRPAP